MAHARRLVFLAGFAAFLCTAGSSQAEENKARWVESSARSIELGRASFGTCMGCHGEDAAGRIGIGPRIASESYLAAASDDFLIRTIKNGRAGTTMVPWGAILSDVQIQAVVAYLRSLHPVEPATLDESELEGVPENGAKIYRSSCSGCHGRSGAGYQETANGTGIGRKAFLDSASNGFIRYIVNHGKTQTKMRGFSAKSVTAVANLSDQEIEDTIAYLRANAW
jgi:mono/diheme cytochrome c family protein